MQSNKLYISVLVTAVLVPLAASSANAQEPPTKHIVFTENAAYVTGVRAVVAGADSEIYPDPRGRYALIAYTDATPRQDAFSPKNPTATTASSSLFVYDGHTGRTKTLWRGVDESKSYTSGNIAWLAGTDVALCCVHEYPNDPLLQSGPSQITSSLVLILPASTGPMSRVIYQEQGFLSISASPTLSLAAIGETQYLTDKDGHASHTTRHFTVDEHGRISPDISLGPLATGGYDWNADGTTTYFHDPVPVSPATDAGGAPQPDKSQWYAFDIKTQALTPIESPPPYARPAKPAETSPLHLVSGAFVPAPLAGAGQAQPVAKATKFAPLWIVRRDGKAEGHLPTAAVIAPDAQESFLLADDSAVLYVADRAVYAVPLTREFRPDIDAAYRKLLQQQAIANAKQIAFSLIGFTQDNDETFPQAGELAATMATYARNDTLLNNLDTDLPGFTFLLAGQKYSDIADPANTVLGYLAGPGGRVVVMADGHAHWEDSP